MKKIIIFTMLLLFLAAGLAGGQASAQDGQKIFMDKCVPCHGVKGDGKGPMAVTFSPPPGNFNDPKFWQGDVNKKISDSITKGKGQMIPVDLKPAEIKAVTDYVVKTFKK